jgi:hypothetical protein
MKTSKIETSKMKTSINLKTSKMRNKYLKLGMMAAVMLSASIGFAQTTVTTDTGLNKGAGDGTSVRVIDNKGTIKYLQTNNGITSITSTAPNNTTTTTWQLGGSLVDATTITTSGNIFTIDGEEFNLAGIGVNSGIAATITDDTGTGYTLLVREEGTGRVKKMLATELITGGQVLFPIAADTDVTVTAAGLALGTDIYKISVYRNGNKLRAVTDYTLNAANTITLVPNSVAPNDWSTFVGDVIEVQWVN